MRAAQSTWLYQRMVHLDTCGIGNQILISHQMRMKACAKLNVQIVHIIAVMMSKDPKPSQTIATGLSISFTHKHVPCMTVNIKPKLLYLSMKVLCGTI